MAWTAHDMPDQTDRVAVVTGGNGGLGLETARELARKGAHVIIAARNLEKAAKAEADIRSDVPITSVDVRQLDLSSKMSIKQFADALRGERDSVDLLFNNAGVMATPERKTADGFELQFGTNHLGHFYLTYLLLPALLRGSNARIVNTTSTARFSAGDYDLTNAHSRGTYKPWEAYGISKRANLHFAIELNNRLASAGSDMTAHAADPGFSNTDLQATSAAESGGFTQKLAHRGVVMMGQSAARGALPQLRAGTDLASPGGTLYRPRWITAGAPVMAKIGANLRKPEDLSQLWAVSERDLDIDFDVAALVAAAS
ncbi:MAG: oxidoreductase [Acidimicrobiia bacterium]|nr:oxidoreductase [Acidimicrobiia bacterium]